MDKIELARNYISLRRLQSKLVRYNFYDELYKNLNLSYVDYYARYLSDIFFHKTKNLEVYNIIVELYKIFLILAPIFQKLRYSYKLDWTRGHFLSQLRLYLSKKVNRKYVRVRRLERKIEPELLQNKLLVLGIRDRRFIEHCKEMLKINYGSEDILRGKLACLIFDPIMFFGENEGFEVRRKNEFIKMEKINFKGAVNVDEKEITVWDYRIKREWDRQNKKTTLKIGISREYIKKQKEEFKNIIKSKNPLERKILLIYYKVNEIIETHKYTKDGFDDLLELKYWLKNRVSGIAAQDKRVNAIVDMLLQEYQKKLNTRMMFKKPNFFWTPEEPKEKIYRYYFSPYREG